MISPRQCQLVTSKLQRPKCDLILAGSAQCADLPAAVTDGATNRQLTKRPIRGGNLAKSRGGRAKSSCAPRSAGNMGRYAQLELSVRPLRRKLCRWPSASRNAETDFLYFMPIREREALVHVDLPVPVATDLDVDTCCM